MKSKYMLIKSVDSIKSFTAICTTIPNWLFSF